MGVEVRDKMSKMPKTDNRGIGKVVAWKNIATAIKQVGDEKAIKAKTVADEKEVSAHSQLKQTQTVSPQGNASILESENKRRRFLAGI